MKKSTYQICVNKSKYLLMEFMTVFLFCSSLLGCSEETSEDKLKKIGKVIDEKWMVVTLGNTTYKVQKAFVQGAGKNYKGYQTDLYLRAYMPGFKQRDQVLNEYGGVSRKDSLNDIDFSFSYSPRINHTPNYAHVNPMAYRLSDYLPIDAIIKQKYTRKEYGLEYYGPYGEVLYKNGFYIFREQNDPRAVLKCDKDIKDTFPACWGNLTFGDEVRLRIHFRKKFLPSWPQIWERLNQIILITKIEK